MQRRSFVQAGLASFYLVPTGLTQASSAPQSLQEILARGGPLFQRTLRRADELQIKIEFARPVNGVWLSESFRPNAEWYAPASLVKLPLAAMVLEQLDAMGVSASQATLSFPEMPACADHASQLRKPQRVAALIERALVLSDDSAYCALYDFLGPARIAARFADMGYAVGQHGVRIQARFGTCGPEQSRITGPWQLHVSNKIIHKEAAQPAFTLIAASKPILIGKAWVNGNRKTLGPKDFSLSNTMPLAVVKQIMLAIMQPNAVPLVQRFKLSEPSRKLLLESLQKHPIECVESCSAAERKQSGTAFRLLGVGDDVWLKSLVVHNKVGWAYGYLSDVAHLQLGPKQCVVACAMYLNADGILNDGRYEYDAIGRPFMAELGRLLLAGS